MRVGFSIRNESDRMQVGRSHYSSISRTALILCRSPKSRSLASSPTVEVTMMNRVIANYSKEGDLVSARRVFDEMLQRDVVTWNSMMTGYAQSGRHDRVLQVFGEMRRSGLTLNDTSVSIGLSSSGKLRALSQGKQIHGLSIKIGSLGNVFVGTCLITMYSRCGVFDCLMLAFEDIDCPSVASWNALISGYVVNRRMSSAKDVFDWMPSRNVISWTTMIDGYIGIGKLRLALELFDMMPDKNSVSWSVMLGGFVSDGNFEEAIKFFSLMMSSGIKATIPIVIKVLRACSGLKSYKQGRKIHGHVIKLAFYIDQMVEASLVVMYCDCLKIEDAKLEFDNLETRSIGSWNSMMRGYINNNKVDEARRLFDVMSARDEISWNSIITGYLRAYRLDDAIDLFSKMPEPTLEATTAVMSSYIDNGRLEEARKLFLMMPQRDVMAYTTLIYGHMKEGLVENALDLFKEMPERTVVTYNVMISGLLQSGKVAEAYELFNECPEKDAALWNALVIGLVQNELYIEAFQICQKMMLSGTGSSALVIASLLRASARLSLLIPGEQLHTVAIKLGHELCSIIGNSLISMYSKCGDTLIAKSIFDQILEPDLVTWNSMIDGYAINGLAKKAIEMFESMKGTNIKPDDTTLLCVLSACNHDCLLEEGLHYFSSMIHEYQIKPSLSHYTCMIDLLSRMGMVEKAQMLISSMPFEPDPVTWTSLLSGCRLKRDIDIAEYAANKLIVLDQRDPMPYFHLIDIYGSAGRWADIRNLRSHIDNIGSKKQSACSWIETSSHSGILV